ncbi:MAG: hypothetical protein ACJ74Z_22315, partial [Bryobacteraceae bacterium]
LHDVFYESSFLVSDVEKKLLEKTYNTETHATELTRNAALLRDSLPDCVSEVIDKPGHLKQRLGRAFSQRRGRWHGEHGTYLESAGEVHKVQSWKVCTKKGGHFSDAETPANG